MFFLVMGKRINVQSYCGYRGNERPDSFELEGERIRVEEVLFTWLEQSTGHRYRCFRIRGDDRHTHVLLHDEQSDVWYMGRP